MLRTAYPLSAGPGGGRAPNHEGTSTNRQAAPSGVPLRSSGWAVRSTMKVDTTEFRRAAAQLVRESSRSYPDFINGQALAVASRAIKHTKKADAAQVAVELGQVATRFSYSKKTGKRRVRRIYGEHTLAHRIVNARRKRAGLGLLFGRDLDSAARRLVTARLRAVAFIKSGWVPAIRDLARRVGYRDRTGGGSAGDAARVRGRPKGYSIPAKSGLGATVLGVVSVEIGNTALITMGKSGTASNPMPIAEVGLQRALDETARDMMEHLRKKLQPIANRHSVRAMR